MVNSTGLIKSYPNGKKIIFPDINIKANESLLIHGPSGSGKTSLLHILAGFVRPDQGSVEINHQKMELLSNVQRDRFRGKFIGVCLQKPIFIHSLTALENIVLYQKLISSQCDKTFILSLFEELKLSDQMHQKTYTLSQGEQQRLMLIRALANKPKLILSDEPTSALDDVNTLNLSTLLTTHCYNHQAALIVVSHDERLKRIFEHKILIG